VRQAGNSLVELVVIVAVALGLALGIQAFLVKPYRIPSPSMVPTLEIGQRVLVNRIGTRFGDPEVGDIVVFHPPTGADLPEPEACEARNQDDEMCADATDDPAETNFIKRVVAGPGDEVALQDGHVVLNGERQKEPYIESCSGAGDCDYPDPITVPEDSYFLLGDNRPSSKDSRFWGPVPEEWIIGEAFATYWPLQRIGLL